MSSGESSRETRRDGKYGECSECGDETYLALTSDGWLCADCLDADLLAEVLDLTHPDE